MKTEERERERRKGGKEKAYHLFILSRFHSPSGADDLTCCHQRENERNTIWLALLNKVVKNEILRLLASSIRWMTTTLSTSTTLIDTA